MDVLDAQEDVVLHVLEDVTVVAAELVALDVLDLVGLLVPEDVLAVRAAVVVVQLHVAVLAQGDAVLLVVGLVDLTVPIVVVLDVLEDVAQDVLQLVVLVVHNPAEQLVRLLVLVVVVRVQVIVLHLADQAVLVVGNVKDA